MLETGHHDEDWMRTLPKSARLVHVAGIETTESLTAEYQGASPERKAEFALFLENLKFAEHAAAQADLGIRL